MLLLLTTREETRTDHQLETMMTKIIDQIRDQEVTKREILAAELPRINKTKENEVI